MQNLQCVRQAVVCGDESMCEMSVAQDRSGRPCQPSCSINNASSSIQLRFQGTGGWWLV